MARPLALVVTCSQGPYSGNRTWQGSPARAAAHGQTLCRGDEATRSSRPRPGLPLARAQERRGDNETHNAMKGDHDSW
ncbi:hypothetical protein B296_00016136 [Ensete ventricosum]|uniref:Uncharacterized protein n=1 Tax=Ensete ventricosum TaxID=4639 RepID=A0A427B523_ENSVE|nr:hypothetical protein B296_00016136 [Ensete ventricosum]